ncbi:hypothetical protein JCM11251_007822 [Rhodosporidiobolus azoricus]
MPPSYEASTASVWTVTREEGAAHGLSSSLPSPPRVPRSPILCPPSPTPSASTMGISNRRNPRSPICPPPYRSGAPTLCAPLSPVSVEGMQDDPHYLATPTQRSYFVALSDMFEECAAVKREVDVEAGRRGEKEMKEKVKAKRASLLIPVLGKGGQLVHEEATPRCFGCCTVS